MLGLRPVSRVRANRLALWLALVPGALLALSLALAAWLSWGPMPEADREAWLDLMRPRWPLLVMAWFLGSALLGAAFARLWDRHAGAPARLAEQLQVALSDASCASLPADAMTGSVGSQALVAAVQGLLQQRAALQTDIHTQVQDASRKVDQERRRLAALMAELTQSVVVCNLDGRVLLFNARARLQFRALALGPSVGGAPSLSLGRSIYGLLDRRLVAHALDSVQTRLARGAPHPTAQFVTATQAGQLLRVQMAPVRAATETAAAPAGAEQTTVLDGFVLMLDNITRDLMGAEEGNREVHAFTQQAGSALGRLQSAVAGLQTAGQNADGADLALALASIARESATLAQGVHELARRNTQLSKMRWPLEDMLGADLLDAALRRIRHHAGCQADAAEVDGALWVRVDSYSMVQALTSLACRLVEAYEIRRVQLRLSRHGPGAHLDLIWFGQALNSETAMGWELDPIRVADETSALTVRDVVDRHGGRFGFERERVRQAAFFRFELPCAEQALEPLDADLVVHSDSRPEFYDFDLFQAAGEAAEALADRPLAGLSFTVFDTETTGLQPAQGDQIIQVGATRVVAGKLRRGDSFDQLVNPGRAIPAAGIPIHGITEAMVRGQPDLETVLPAFHEYVGDTVLVAHNAAFDMRFLQLAEPRSGVRFTQPVLDTLLLSAVVHPQQESHRLEAIAERFGVEVLGRHTALGDAMVTAEVFMKMLPLLEALGIHTLRQAQEAARQTRFARVTY
jgi:DNA polymerase-3 subunit epsilon